MGSPRLPSRGLCKWPTTSGSMANRPSCSGGRSRRSRRSRACRRTTLSRAKFEYSPRPADRRDAAPGPAFRASHAEYQAVRGGGDALSRRGDRRSAAQAQGEPGRAAPSRSGRAFPPGWRRRYRAMWSRCESRCARRRCRTWRARCASSRCGSETGAPDVKAVRDLRRSHIERYKRHLAERPNRRGQRCSKRTIAGALSTLLISAPCSGSASGAVRTRRCGR